MLTTETIIIRSNEEAQRLVKDGVLDFGRCLEIAFDGFKIDADLKGWEIKSKDYPRSIDAHNINVEFIKASDVKASDIYTSSIEAKNIEAENIEGMSIDAMNINVEYGDIIVDVIDAMNVKVHNIIAGIIDANDIKYYAVCCAYWKFKCHSVKSTEKKSKHFCLQGRIGIRKKEKVKKFE
jgi:hypothetical protein